MTKIGERVGKKYPALEDESDVYRASRIGYLNGSVEQKYIDMDAVQMYLYAILCDRIDDYDEIVRIQQDMRNFMENNL